MTMKAENIIYKNKVLQSEKDWNIVETNHIEYSKTAIKIAKKIGITELGMKVIGRDGLISKYTKIIKI
jgi:hypothetical protein